MQVFFQRGIGPSALVHVRSIRYLAITARTQMSLPFTYYLRRYGLYYHFPARPILHPVKSSLKFRSFSGSNNWPNGQKAPMNPPEDAQRQTFTEQQQIQEENRDPIPRACWLRPRNIILGILISTIFVFGISLLLIGYAGWKLYQEMRYKKKLREAFDTLDEDHDGLVSIDDLWSKWRQIQMEVLSWKPKECENDFRMFWARIVEIGDKSLGDCNNTVLDIFQFSDLVAAVLFNSANVDGKNFITEADLRALAGNIPDIKTKDVDKITGFIFSQFDLDEDGQITLQDVQFRLREELKKDSPKSKNSKSCY